MYDRAMMRAELSRDEGRQDRPYQDTEGNWTVGVGWNLEANNIPLEHIVKLLEDRGMPEAVIDGLLDVGIARAEQDLTALYPEWELLSEARQRALVNMAFNLGRERLAGFQRMWAAIHARQFGEAAREMLDSRWARQVGIRAVRLSEMMREG